MIWFFVCEWNVRAGHAAGALRRVCGQSLSGDGPSSSAAASTLSIANAFGSCELHLIEAGMCETDLVHLAWMLGL